MTEKTLDQRIADAFAASHSSTDLRALLAEVQAASVDAARQSDAARLIALDPATPPADVATARKAMEDARFTRDRLAVATGKLEELHREAVKVEQEAARGARVSALSERRDAMAAELREKYPALANGILDLLRRMTAIDAECRAIGMSTSEDLARLGSGQGIPLMMSRIADFERRYDGWLWADGQDKGVSAGAVSAASVQPSAPVQKWVEVPTLSVTVENMTRGQAMLFLDAGNNNRRVGPGQRVPATILEKDLAKFRENFSVDVHGAGTPVTRAA